MPNGLGERGSGRKDKELNTQRKGENDMEKNTNEQTDKEMR